MGCDRDWALWREFRNAWERAEMLQMRCAEENLLFSVIYDRRQGRWLVACTDTSRWITERFHGGHRGYYVEVWRQA